jgi:hypothetical protein
MLPQNGLHPSVPLSKLTGPLDAWRVGLGDGVADCEGFGFGGDEVAEGVGLGVGDGVGEVATGGGECVVAGGRETWPVPPGAWLEPPVA